MPNNDPTKIFTPEESAAWLTGLEKRISSACVWLETADGRLLIIKSDYKRHWSVPGGIIDAGETPQQAASREVQEEVGLTVPSESLKFEAVIDRVSDGIGHTYQFVFSAPLADELIDTVVLQESEVQESAFVSRDAVLANDQVNGRYLGKIIFHWARHRSGYIEQTFSYDD